jgi:general secretion pathway protein I
MTRPTPPRPHGERGFTLLEVMIALAILSVAIVACIEGFSQGLRLLKLAGDHQQAILLADEKAREVVTPAPGQEQGSEGRFAWERVTREIPAPELVVVGQLPRVKVFEVTVRVRWDERRQLEVATLRTASTAETSQPPGPRR